MSAPPRPRISRVHRIMSGFAAAALGLLGVGPAQAALGQEQPDIVIWLPLSDAEFFGDGTAAPSLRDQTLFFSDLPAFLESQGESPVWPGLAVADLRDKTLLDAGFARSMLGQRSIFRELSRFATERALTGRIVVRFFDWQEFLDVLDNLGTTPEEGLPHLLGVPSTWTARLADRGVLAPLSNVDTVPYLGAPLQTAKALGPVAPFPLGAFQRAWRTVGRPQNGDLYSLPWSVDVRMLFYWKNRLGEGPFAHRNEFEAALQRAAFQAAEDSLGGFRPPMAWAGERDFELLHSGLSLLIWGAGADWMHSRRKFFPKDAASDGVEFLLRLRESRAAAFPPVTRAVLEDMFLDSLVSGVLAGPWMIPRLNERLGANWPTRVGVQLPPLNVPGQEQVTFLGGIHLGLTQPGVEAPVALQLLTFLTTTPSASSGLVALPGSKDGFRSALASLPSGSGLDALLSRAVEEGRYYPPIPEWADVVERQGTRLELFQVFKHLGDNNRDLVLRDLAAFEERVQNGMYGSARGSALAMIGWLFSLMIASYGSRRWVLRRARFLVKQGLEGQRAFVQELQGTITKNEREIEELKQARRTYKTTEELKDAIETQERAKRAENEKLIQEHQRAEGAVKANEEEAKGIDLRVAVDVLRDKPRHALHFRLDREGTISIGESKQLKGFQNKFATFLICDALRASALRTEFSAIHACLLDWNGLTKGSLEGHVSALRGAFGEKVIPKVKTKTGWPIYEFELSPNHSFTIPGARWDYLDYKNQVVKPFNLANELKSNPKDLEFAQRNAEAAFDGQLKLEVGNVEVCLLFVTLSAETGRKGATYEEAIKRLKQYQIQYDLEKVWKKMAVTFALTAQRMKEEVLPPGLAVQWAQVRQTKGAIDTALRLHAAASSIGLASTNATTTVTTPADNAAATPDDQELSTLVNRMRNHYGSRATITISDILDATKDDEEESSATPNQLIDKEAVDFEWLLQALLVRHRDLVPIEIAVDTLMKDTGTVLLNLLRDQHPDSKDPLTEALALDLNRLRTSSFDR